MLCCETRSCHACRHNDLEGHSNFSSTIYSFSILVSKDHYCWYQQWRSLTYNPPSAFVYFRWSWFWSCYFGLGFSLKNLVLFTSLTVLRFDITQLFAWRGNVVGANTNDNYLEVLQYNWQPKGCRTLPSKVVVEFDRWWSIIDLSAAAN